MMATQQAQHQSQQQQRTNTLPLKLKNVRPMPKWVTETHDRIGPKPPAIPPNGDVSHESPPALPPKGKFQPEPDYEVIEFSGQQYSNEPQGKLRPKTPDATQVQLKCTLCGSNNPWVKCEECAHQIFCTSCDDMFHKHPKRKNHLRKALDISRPPIPPKITPGQAQAQAPVAPPRRNKRGCPSPMLVRKDQINTEIGMPPSPTPSSQSSTAQSWHNRVGSLKRSLHLSTRPLPETPKTPIMSDGATSRSTTPRSVFDTIQRPPSVTLEKIKSKASATLDRMAILQQRYRQHKDEKERNFNGGNPIDQHFDQWSNNSPSQFCSMSSGLNSSHFDITDDFHFNSFHHQKQQQHIQQRNGGLGGRNMSTSVFNLNQTSRGHMEPQNNNWMRGNQMQQAQSMAQLNCMNCNQHQQQPQADDWHQHHPHQHPQDWAGAHPSNLNRSNLSLNVPHSYFMRSPHGAFPPPVFMNPQAMPQIYPYPYPVINPGMMGVPPIVRSRTASRGGSRLPSPTLSRKSINLRKKRTSYAKDDPTDDEDSEEDDCKSLMSQRSGVITNHRSRYRRASNASQSIGLDDDSEITNPRSLRSKIREQRRGSGIVKPIQSEWTPQRRSSGNYGHKSPRIYSDSPLSLESEGSEQQKTRVLVQAKIQEKLNESSAQKQKAKEKQPMPLVAKKQNASNQPTKLILEKPLKDSESVSDVDSVKEEPLVEPDAKPKDESPPLGPPPSTPDHEWECEFCTFVNEPKVKICTICCKTPSRQANRPKDKANQKIQNKSNQLGKKKNSSTSTTTTVSKVQPEIKKPVQGNKTKESSLEDIWATLDENIQTTADEVKRKAAESKSDFKEKNEKKSTGCGQSPPPRETDSQLNRKVDVENKNSMVPQNISTQTYDYLPLNKPEKPESEEEKFSSNPRITEKYLERAPCEVGHQVDTIESPILKPRTKSLFEHNSVDPETITNIERNLQFFRDMSLIQSERDRYRSSNDLRMAVDHIDFRPQSSGLSRRQSLAEMLATQKIQAHQSSNDYFEPKPSRNVDSELFLLLKEAELYKFTPEELHAALKLCNGDTHPIVWLRENWSKFVQTVQNLVMKYGQECSENNIGNISQIEAREALRMHSGNIWQAVSECIEQRQRKFRDIANRGNFSREDITTALTVHQGNVDMALLDLTRNQLKPFLMRVWGSPEGIENESGYNGQQHRITSDEISIKSKIHDFLNANAMECIPSSLSTTDSSSMKDHPLHLHSALNHIHNNNQTEHQSNYNTSMSNLSIFSYQSKEEDSIPIDFDRTATEAHNGNETKQKVHSMEALLGNLLATKGSSYTAVEINSDGVKNLETPEMQEDIATFSSDRNDSFESMRLPPIPPPVADPEEFIMEEIIKPNLKYSVEDEQPSLSLEECTNMIKFEMELEKGIESHQLTDFEATSLEDAERIVFHMFKVTESPPKEDEVSSVVNTMKSSSLEDIDSKLWEEVDENEKSTRFSKNYAFRVGWNKRNNRRKQKSRAFGKKLSARPVDEPSGETFTQTENKSTLESTETLISSICDEKLSVLSQGTNSSNGNLLLMDSKEEIPIVPNENTNENFSIIETTSKSSFQHSNVHNETEDHRILSSRIPKSRLKKNQSMNKKVEPRLNVEEKEVPERMELNHLESETNQESNPREYSRANNKIPKKSDQVVGTTLPSTNLNETSTGDHTVIEQETTPLAKMMSAPNMAQKKTSKIPVFRTNSSPTISKVHHQSTSWQENSTNHDLVPAEMTQSVIESNQEEVLIEIKGETATILDSHPIFHDDSEEVFVDVPEYENTQDEKSEGTETDFHNVVDDESISTIEEFTNGDDMSSDGELYSVVSDGPLNVDADTLQAPTSENEMILILGGRSDTHYHLENESILNSFNLDLISSYSSKTSSTEDFATLVHQNPASKQNLSELVKDTQRLIKQMKEEINSDMAAFDSDEEEYTDDGTEEYDEEDLEEEIIVEEEEEDFDDEQDVEYSYEEEENSQYDIEAQSGEEDLSETHQEGSLKEVQITSNTGKEEYLSSTEVHSLPLDQSLSPSSSLKSASDIHNAFHNEQSYDMNFAGLTMSEVLVQKEINETKNSQTNELSAKEAVENPDAINEHQAAIPKSLLQISEASSTESAQTFPNLEGVLSINENSNLKNENTSEETTEISGQNNVGSNEAIFETETNHKQTDETENEELEAGKTQPSEREQTEKTADLIEEEFSILSESSKHEIQTKAQVEREEAGIISTNSTSENDNAMATHTTDTERSISNADPKIFEVNVTEKYESKQQPDTTISSTSNHEKPTANKFSVSKIPKPKSSSFSNASTNVSTFPKKVTNRSNSFPGGPSLIGINSVKAIKQEFINKQSALAPPQTLPKNPPPMLRRKKSITDTISKLIKPSTSSFIEPVPNCKQPRLPKKNYHETCFSDEDYQTTTSEDETAPVAEDRIRKQSAPVFRTYESIQEVEVENPEVLAKKFMDQQLVTSYAEAHIAGALVSMKFPQDAALWAAKECNDLDQAISLLRQECELCMGVFPMNQIVSMLKCTHKCCKECAKNYFTVQITERSINDCNCPFCKMPDLHESKTNEDENLEYFSNLDILLKSIVTADAHELFQRKLRDRTLLQDPNFKWCVQCSSGFFARPKQKRLICPDCGSVTCSQCRKPWEKQHENLSCEKYLEWKQMNDPELQANGVTEHLAKNGIDCPKCHFRYSLARGGCMHFTCTQCKFEFCYGCGRPFTMGAKCSISPYCSKLGLHAHHPRNCLFYLRDKDPSQLQQLLRRNHVIFDETPPDTDRRRRSPIRCPIPLQKETPRGLVDVVCKNDVPDRHAGLCRTHYVEYLAGKVAKANIDPLPIFDLTDCIQELRRRGMALPERGPWDTDEIYREMCSKVIREKIPL